VLNRTGIIERQMSVHVRDTMQEIEVRSCKEGGEVILSCDCVAAFGLALKDGARVAYKTRSQIQALAPDLLA
jgi:hypothetical protein